VSPLEGRPVVQATRFTIQVGTDAHLDPVSERESPWAYLNHGCDPNVAIDVRRRAIVARRPIRAGDELRFDYNTTEWELAESFVCNCGTAQCVGVVLGFAHLSPARQQVLLRDAAPHIRALHAARLWADRARQAETARGRWPWDPREGRVPATPSPTGRWGSAVRSTTED
jgi:hypothetical protein